MKFVSALLGATVVFGLSFAPTAVRAADDIGPVFGPSIDAARADDDAGPVFGTVKSTNNPAGQLTIPIDGSTETGGGLSMGGRIRLSDGQRGNGVRPDYKSALMGLFGEGSLHRPSTQFLRTEFGGTVINPNFAISNVHEDIQYYGGYAEFPLWGARGSRPGMDLSLSAHVINSESSVYAATLSAGGDQLGILDPTGGGFLLAAGPASDLANVLYRSKLDQARISVELKSYFNARGESTYMGAPGAIFAPHLGLQVTHRESRETFSAVTNLGTLTIDSTNNVHSTGFGVSLGGYAFTHDIMIPGLKGYGGVMGSGSVNSLGGTSRLGLTGAVTSTSQRDFSGTEVTFDYEIGAGVQYNRGNFSLDAGYKYLNQEVPDIVFPGTGVDPARLASERSAANLWTVSVTYRFR